MFNFNFCFTKCEKKKIRDLFCEDFYFADIHLSINIFSYTCKYRYKVEIYRINIHTDFL